MDDNDDAGGEPPPLPSPSPVGLDSSALWRFLYTCPLALLLTDGDGEIRALNGAATALLMPHCPGGALGNLFALVSRWSPDAEATLRAAKDRREPTVVRARTGDARSRWLELHASAFDGGLSVTCQDVTDVVAQQDEVIRLASEEAHQRGRAEMGAAILHDMGNALTGIGSRAVAVRTRVIDERVPRNLARLIEFLRPHAADLGAALGDDKSRALLALLDSMRAVSAQLRDEAIDHIGALNTYLGHAQELLAINRTYARATPISAYLGQLLLDLQTMTEASFRGRDGALIIDAPREPVRLSADRSKLMQILLNLVKNAQEAWDARDGGRDDADDDRSALARPALARPALAVRVEAGVTADGGLRITVRDNGCGFAPEHTASLFALGESSKARGTGTGLHAARNIAIGLGGSLELSSPGPGAGATASLTLPSEVIYRESSP